MSRPLRPQRRKRRAATNPEPANSPKIAPKAHQNEPEEIETRRETPKQKQARGTKMPLRCRKIAMIARKQQTTDRRRSIKIIVDRRAERQFTKVSDQALLCTNREKVTIVCRDHDHRRQAVDKDRDKTVDSLLKRTAAKLSTFYQERDTQGYPQPKTQQERGFAMVIHGYGLTREMLLSRSDRPLWII